MRKLNKTEAVYKILNSGGKMFSIKWKTNGGQERKLNGKLSAISSTRKNQDKIFGYLTLYDVHKKSFKRINTRSITELLMQKKRYKIK